MQELNHNQLKQVSGGVLLSQHSEDPSIYLLILYENERFFYGNVKTGTDYLFFYDGMVLKDGGFYALGFQTFVNDNNRVFIIPSNFFSFC